MKKFLEKNCPAIAGFAALVLSAAFVAMDDDSVIFAIVACVALAVLVACAIYKFVEALKKKNIKEAIPSNKNEWFVCGISLIYAAVCYKEFSIKSAGVFLLLAAISLINYILYLVKSSK